MGGAQGIEDTSLATTGGVVAPASPIVGESRAGRGNGFGFEAGEPVAVWAIPARKRRVEPIAPRSFLLARGRCNPALQPADLRRQFAVGRVAQKCVDAALILDRAD